MVLFKEVGTLVGMEIDESGKVDAKEENES